MRRILVAAAVCACSSGASFEGLAPAVDRGGPKVSFDLTHKPLPEIPFPNDLATRPDSGSPTGLRLNASLIAPSQLERDVRGLLDTLDGFGTYAPITVAFDQDLDVLDLFNRQNNSDPADDGVYLVDLVDGTAMPLDFNGGHFPYTLNDPGKYFLNDPNSGAFNLLFPVGGQFANFLHPAQPHDTLREQADDLLTFYERETRTLVMRPVLPLKQERRYAVVLTDRIRGTGGAPISSPHAGINHAAQTAELQPLLRFLPAGTRLSDIAYTWAFTTQSTTRDLQTIRRGLTDGKGPFSSLNFAYRVQGGTTTSYATLIQVLQERGAFTPGTASQNTGDYILPVECEPGSQSCLKSLLSDPAVQNLLVGTDPAEVSALLDTFKYVDYLVSGTFISPDFLQGGSGTPFDQTFHIDAHTGNALTVPAEIPFILSVPKERPEVGHVAPFPTVIAGHGYGSTRIEHVLGFGGTFAKFGLATISIDAYGHGLALDPVTEATARAIARKYGLDAFADVLFTGRARDLDYDGVKDSGGDFWTAETFHTRDVVRQSVVDWMQLVRVLQTFDGFGQMTLGTKVALAGDFNFDGIPDIAGPSAWPQDVFLSDRKTKIFSKGAANPGADLFVYGISLGGILTAVLPAVEPAIVAAAPVSGAGGLADVGIRSSLDPVVNAVFLETFGPFFANCHYDAGAGPADPQTGINIGSCVAGTPDTLVLVVQDVNRERDIPIAALTLQPQQQVMVKNLAQNPTGTDCLPVPPSTVPPKIDGCALGTADGSGLLRLPVSADWPSLIATRTPQPAGLAEKVQVQVIAPGDPLSVSVLPMGAGEQRVIDKFELPARFSGVDYKPQDPLTSPARGYGLSRNTPEFRRLMGLSQLIVEPGDPINYAPHYFGDLLAARSKPANVLVVGTSGDPAVPVNTAIALARAAGLVEMKQPDPAYGIPIDQVLIQSGVVEGVPATARFADPAALPLPGHVRCDPGSDCTGSVLVDPSGYSCDADGASCTDGLNAPRLDPPLRQQLVRQSMPAAVNCPISQRVLGTGCWSIGPSACDASAPGVSALLLPYLNRTGQHGFRNPQPGKPFDMDQFMANLIGRFFECRGRELRFDACQTDLASPACSWIPQPPP